MLDDVDDVDMGAVLEEAAPELKQILGEYGIPPKDAEGLLEETLVLALSQWETFRKHKEVFLPLTLRTQCLLYQARSRRSRQGWRG